MKKSVQKERSQNIPSSKSIKKKRFNEDDEFSSSCYYTAQKSNTSFN